LTDADAEKMETVVGLMTVWGPLPVKIGLAGQYMVHHPDIGGQKWNIQLSVSSVIPKLIKGNLMK